MRAVILLAWFAGAASFVIKSPLAALPRSRSSNMDVVSMRLGPGFGGSIGFRKSSAWSKSLGRFLGKGGIFWKPPGMGGNNGGKGPRGMSAEPSEPEEPEKKEDDSAGPWAAYERSLQQNPVLIKGLTSFIGFTIGDLLAQFFIEKSGPYDPLRTLRLARYVVLCVPLAYVSSPTASAF